jgi:hypothetical protein
MTIRFHDIGIARQISAYSDAVEAPANGRWLFALLTVSALARPKFLLKVEAYAAKI